jgi:hypothetical protein
MREGPLAAASCAIATRLRCLTCFPLLLGQLFGHRKATKGTRRRCIVGDGIDSISFHCERCYRKEDMYGVRAGAETWQINKAPLVMTRYEVLGSVHVRQVGRQVLSGN